MKFKRLLSYGEPTVPPAVGPETEPVIVNAEADVNLIVHVSGIARASTTRLLMVPLPVGVAEGDHVYCRPN